MYYTTAEGPRARGLKHNPINALVAPRPIGWINTIDSLGRPNLAPFSYFNLVSAEPPIVMFAPNEKDSAGTPKDSLVNVRQVPEFVVNIVPWRLREQMNLTSAVLEHGASEFEFAGLAPVPSTLVRPPRIAEAPASLECRVLQVVALPRYANGRQSHVVLGEVLAVHIDDAVISDGVLDVLALQPMARLGGHDYTWVEHVTRMPRPPGGPA